MPEITTRRLRRGDRAYARALFAMMAGTFGEDAKPVSSTWVEKVLSSDSFWAIAAHVDGELAGGVTAHALPMTRAEELELFIYDIAVHPAHQRHGVGRALVDALRTLAHEEGIGLAFVPADDADVHALAFYRALGGQASPVTFFTFDARRRGN